ncbi:hypothetical protein DL96DRAFT_1741902 [Flagelloscypha sp. PMI_526]|nr:hypothetical protein DL96DRAFT_1741902 [Flagelloscypha sp. PMI_526]
MLQQLSGLHPATRAVSTSASRGLHRRDLSGCAAYRRRARILDKFHPNPFVHDRAGRLPDNDHSPTVGGVLHVTIFEEDETGSTYCVLSETSTTSEGYYLRGWGLAIARLDVNETRTVHFSAPHPIFDGDTPQQAAAVFSATSAKSLLVDGRHRGALLEATPCIHPSDPSTIDYRTDPTHDNEEPFVTASLAILDWQVSQGGCPSASCAFVQFHGKAETSCPNESAFLSSGLGTSASSIAWYQDSTDRPIKRIKSLIPKYFPDPTFVATMPSDGTGCGLTATTNVIGRTMNGVPRADVCTTAATASTATGMFVHIEQSFFTVSSAVYGNWSNVFQEAFPVAD